MTSEWFMNYLCHPCNACVTMVVTYNTGLAHTYPDILEKGDYFLRRLDRIPFMYDIVVLESNLRFRPFTRKKILKPAFSKNSFLGTGFENLHFCCPKTLYTYGRKSAE